MQVREAANGLSVRAIAGTDVVLFGLDVSPEAAKGLLGFEIERSRGREKRWLYGGMTFRDGLKPDGACLGFENGAPIQAFFWGDYNATRGTKYTYTVKAKYGKPAKMEARTEVSVEVTTEDPARGVHGVYFNRGVAGSEAYNRQFGEHRSFYLLEKYGRERWTPFIRPDQVPGDDAWKWLRAA